MKWLLIILASGFRYEAISTEPFSDQLSCNNAGSKIKQYVENNDGDIGSRVKFLCIQVTGK